MYNFYIKLDGEQFGPFSATQIVNQYLDDLENFEDIEVMESSIGIWCHASEYPWDELVQKEAQAPIICHQFAHQPRLSQLLPVLILKRVRLSPRGIYLLSYG